MTNQIKLGIMGYGNVGKGVEKAIEKNSDLKLAAIFTRRNPKKLTTLGLAEKILPSSALLKYKDKIDVLILCGGSATDLPEQGPHFASLFNTVDSFDTHAKIPEYFTNVDRAAKKAGKISIIATGWDPGLFSLLRLISEAVLPQGKSYTFWGEGVSQGHSDAIRRIKGVKDARQYTMPIKSSLEKVRAGENPDLGTEEKHWRNCYVCLEEGADKEKIKEKIINMPNYFADYKTKVTFISAEEMAEKHAAMPHGGFVLRSGETTANHKQLIEYRLQLESNPEFTGSVLTAYARAAYRLNLEGQQGARTVFDIAPCYLSPHSPQELRKELL